MKMKELPYEAPEIDLSEMLPASGYLVSVSVQESMITDDDPYFDDEI